MNFKITSSANDTKWRELQSRMASDGLRAPSWKATYLPNTVGGMWALDQKSNRRAANVCFGENIWDGEWRHHFRSDNRYKDMEFVDVIPKLHDTAMQIPEIEMICRSIGLDFEILEKTIRIYGYRRTP